MVETPTPNFSTPKIDDIRKVGFPLPDLVTAAETKIETQTPPTSEKSFVAKMKERFKKAEEKPLSESYELKDTEDKVIGKKDVVTYRDGRQESRYFNEQNEMIFSSRTTFDTETGTVTEYQLDDAKTGIPIKKTGRYMVGPKTRYRVEEQFLENHDSQLDSIFDEQGDLIEMRQWDYKKVDTGISQKSPQYELTQYRVSEVSKGKTITHQVHTQETDPEGNKIIVERKTTKDITQNIETTTEKRTSEKTGITIESQVMRPIEPYQEPRINEGRTITERDNENRKRSEETWEIDDRDLPDNDALVLSRTWKRMTASRTEYDEHGNPVSRVTAKDGRITRYTDYKADTQIDYENSRFIVLLPKDSFDPSALQNTQYTTKEKGDIIEITKPIPDDMVSFLRLVNRSPLEDHIRMWQKPSHAGVV